MIPLNLQQKKHCQYLSEKYPTGHSGPQVIQMADIQNVIWKLGKCGVYSEKESQNHPYHYLVSEFVFRFAAERGF